MAPNKKTKTDLLLLPSHVACGFWRQAARVREGALGKLLGHGAQQAHQPRLCGCSWETEQKHGSPKHLTAQLPTEGRSLAPHAGPRERGSSWHTRRRPQGCRHRLGSAGCCPGPVVAHEGSATAARGQRVQHVLTCASLRQMPTERTCGTT